MFLRRHPCVIVKKSVDVNAWIEKTKNILSDFSVFSSVSTRVCEGFQNWWL